MGINFLIALSVASVQNLQEVMLQAVNPNLKSEPHEISLIDSIITRKQRKKLTVIRYCWCAIDPPSY
jgi:hypothetical protein